MAARREIESVCGHEYRGAMNEHPSFLVYQHLGRFFESRKLELAAGVDLDTGRDRFLAELEHTGYYRADAKSADEMVVSVLLLAPSGKYTGSGPELRRLITSLDSEDFAKQKRLDEVIVVAPEDVIAKKNMTDVIDAIRRESAARAAGEETQNQALAGHYNMYAYHVLSLDVPRAQCVPEHTIADQEAVATFLEREKIGIADLKRIASSNPPVIWIGARPGQVVRIVAPSETAGEAYDYCLVTKS